MTRFIENTQTIIVDSVPFEVTTWFEEKTNMVDVEAFAWVSSKYLGKGSSLERVEIATYSKPDEWENDFLNAARTAMSAV